MTSVQYVAIGICVVLNMLDGYDVLVMAFTAPAVSGEWSLSGTALGLLLSAGLFGMAAGSLFIAPWADRFGRRPLILWSLSVISAGMLASSFAESMQQLAAMRVITGLGIGAILASITVMTSEYASRRWRSAAISIMAAGYSIGTIAGGSIAVVLISNFGWRSAFVFGAALSMLMLPIVWFALPESLDFLLTKQPRRALEKINAVLRRMRRPELRELPDSGLLTLEQLGSVKSLVGNGLLHNTVLIWIAFFMTMAAFYFVMSWTPKLLVESGLSAQQGITGGIVLNVGGLLGSVLIGLLASRFELKSVAAIYFLLATVSVGLFGLAGSALTASLLTAALIGFFITGAISGLYSTAPLLYPANIRTTGMGWAIGIGRVGAIVAPLAAGSLLDEGWTPGALYGLFSVPLLVALGALLAIRFNVPCLR